MSSPERGLSHMLRMADGRGDDLRVQTVHIENLFNFTDQVEAVVADIVKASQERGNIRRLLLLRQEAPDLR